MQRKTIEVTTYFHNLIHNSIQIFISTRNHRIGIRAADAADSQLIELGKVQTGNQTRSQETIELQQEFDMAEKMYQMAEKLGDKEEMASNHDTMKQILKKRKMMSSINTGTAPKKTWNTTPSSAVSSSSSSSSLSLSSLNTQFPHFTD